MLSPQYSQGRQLYTGQSLCYPYGNRASKNALENYLGPVDVEPVNVCIINAYFIIVALINV